MKARTSGISSISFASVSSSYYETNQYGANVLREAVNYGYQQGFRAGEADRQDRWRSNYQDSYPYQDANYGYGGYYIDRDDYNYYFRQGFRRGYEDGYNSRYQYGSYSNGKYTILVAILGSILDMESLR
jgi:flagellar biosynthesis/type III secretory pathway protein FliH